MTETTTAQESGKWSDHCPYSDGMFLPSMQLMAPHEENYRIIDAAIRYALQRIARFASGTLLGNNYSAAHGHVRSCYLSAAQCLEAACSSFPVWQYASRFGRETMLIKPTSVQLGCSHLIGGHRLVR